MATIEEVAALAGVSIATVSRVMNNSYIVSQDKRDKVQAAAASLNYQTNRSPSRPHENKMILVIGSAIRADVISGIQDKARENGYDIVISYANGPYNAMGTVSLIGRNLIDGIILLNYQLDPSELDSILSQCPVIDCGCTQKWPESVIVSINNERAASDVVMHLGGLKKRRIGLLMPEFDKFVPLYYVDRERGYRLALQDLNLPYDPALIFSCDLSPEGVNDVIDRMMGMENGPDALFCVNDKLAAAVLLGLSARGVTVPQRLAVAGFDNDEISELLFPPLTTINQPYYEIGGECARLLVNMIRESSRIGRHVMLSHNLIVRASSVG